MCVPSAALRIFYFAKPIALRFCSEADYVRRRNIWSHELKLVQSELDSLSFAIIERGCKTLAASIRSTRRTPWSFP